jgi:hypothetical protein
LAHHTLLLPPQHFSRTLSPTPSQEDYKIGLGDLNAFPVARNTNRRPAVFEPIEIRLRTTHPQDVTHVPMTPAAVGNLERCHKTEQWCPP